MGAQLRRAPRSGTGGELRRPSHGQERASLECQECVAIFCRGCLDQIHVSQRRRHHTKISLLHFCGVCRREAASLQCADCFNEKYCGPCYTSCHERGWRTHRPAIRIKPSLQASNDAYLMGYIDRQTGGGAPRPDYLELVHLQQRASKTWSRSQDELPVCKDAKQWKYLNFEYIRKHGTPDCHEVEIELWQFTLLFSICGIWSSAAHSPFPLAGPPVGDPNPDRDPEPGPSP